MDQVVEFYRQMGVYDYIVVLVTALIAIAIFRSLVR